MLDESRARLKAKNAEYEKENDQIRSDSEGDRHAAELAAHRHHRFEYAEVALHIAVVLCSLTLLTEMRLFFQLGVAATVAGIVLAASGFLITPDGPSANPHAPAAPSAPASHP
jgi:hypothetical protein